MRRYCNIVVLSFVLLATGCGRNVKQYRIFGEAQGSYYTVVYYDTQHRNIQGSVDSLLADFDLTASLWVDNSMIRRVNAGCDSVVNEMFADMIEKSNQIHDLTGGCFDCTIGAIVNAWGFGFRTSVFPRESLLDSLKRFSGQRVAVERDSRGNYIVHKPHPKTEIDLNAIAQGYSADLVAEWMTNNGIDNFLVDIGGEVVAKGCKSGGKPWVVGVERPADSMNAMPEVQISVNLTDMAIVTSGSYRKYYEKDGVRYSHTIDPVTGHPVEHTLLSVTVIDSTSWRADAMATAFMVMGRDRALKFMSEHPEALPTDAVYFISSNGKGFDSYATEGFKRYMRE